MPTILPDEAKPEDVQECFLWLLARREYERGFCGYQWGTASHDAALAKLDKRSDQDTWDAVQAFLMAFDDFAAGMKRSTKDYFCDLPGNANSLLVEACETRLRVKQALNPKPKRPE